MLVVPFVLSGVPQPMAREAAAASHPAEAAARFRTRIEEAPLPEETVYRRALQFTVGVHVPGGYAAGVVLTPGGKVLTNHHVVENGFDHVLLPEGRQVRATLIADGPEHDLALLQLEEVSDLATAELAGRVEDGQTIYALGFPDRQPYQLTRSSAELDVQCPRFPDCVSAPRGFLRPGNSGGPLLDHQAEWVGVNSGIDGESGTAISLHPEHVQEFLRNNLPAAGQAPAPDRPSFAPAPPAPTEQEALRRRQYRQRPPLQQ
jgi:S1-C subfamily serine protease